MSVHLGRGLAVDKFWREKQTNTGLSKYCSKKPLHRAVSSFNQPTTTNKPAALAKQPARHGVWAACKHRNKQQQQQPTANPASNQHQPNDSSPITKPQPDKHDLRY
jgi:hypothetical protein